MAYEFRVRPVTSVGEGPWSNIAIAELTEVPPPPPPPPSTDGNYEFRVRPVTSVGEGPWSNIAIADVTTGEVLNTAPTPPSSIIVMTTVNHGEVSINWTTPSHDGGSAITGYNVRSSVDGFVWTTHGVSVDKPRVISGLAPVATLFQVAAVNTVGQSEWSASSSYVTPTEAPPPPPPPLPSTDGNYEFRVRAVTSIGEGPWSNVAYAEVTYDVTTAPIAPLAVASTVTVNHGEVSVTWDESYDGGSAITGYNVRSSVDGFVWTTHGVSVDKPRVISGLAPVATLFQVAAVNTVGQSEWSASSSYVTPTASPVTTAPIAPLAVASTVTVNHGEVSVTWDESYDGGSAITGYNVRSSVDGFVWTTHGVSVDKPRVISGLAPVATLFQVAAVNTVGQSEWSASSSYVTPTEAVVQSRLKLGSQTIVSVKLGSTPITKMMLGSTQVFP